MEEGISGIFAQIITSKRRNLGMSLEEVANKAGLHRTTIGLIEKNERHPTLDVARKISDALELKLSDIIMSIETGYNNEITNRQASNVNSRNESKLFDITGLDSNMLLEAINHCYHTLDIIDKQLIANNAPRLANLVELANLSSIMGNILGAGIAIASNGLYIRNKPHTYPDLLPQRDPAKNLELKIALETNKPKGHLPKEGIYMIFRYILGDINYKYIKGKNNRGNVVWIWEVKVGYLSRNDFVLSNTPGDSGKTAVIKTECLNSMALIYYDKNLLPYSGNKKYPGLN